MKRLLFTITARLVFRAPVLHIITLRRRCPGTLLPPLAQLDVIKTMGNRREVTLLTFQVKMCYSFNHTRYILPENERIHAESILGKFDLICCRWVTLRSVGVIMFWGSVDW